MIASQSREGWFQSRPFQFSAYGIQHDFQTLIHQPVLKPNDSHLELLQKLIAFLVRFLMDLIHMHRTVQFDRNAIFWAIKVDSIRTYSVLPAELDSIQL